ncbi:hypothetical protein GCM10008904_24940 [Paraclostridium ghonii]|uniref:LysM domain-containing protein n=1 Tax=Paraclostridium ghonii TaxID=29358 RepID=A0ABU0MZ11_9FIRM|nr:LysM domain-containing protein [Paeniclostridium ghonii]MDQ0556155.1 hypothetical protein [Paeniclostridium ghonii]
MKYALFIVVVLLFIGTCVEDCTSLSQVFREGIYNYITCLDTSVNYLSENVPAFNNLTELSYNKAYEKVMNDRHLVKHVVKPGETLDSIIKSYNTDIKDIDDFRKVIYKENIDIISSDYNLNSGECILVPSE